MATISEVRLRLKAEGGKIVAQEVDQVGDSIDGLGDKAERTQKKTGGVFASLGKQLKMAARTGGLALGALGTQSVYAGINFNKTFESATASFSTFLGSTEKAEQFTENLRSVSRESPLRLTDYMEGARALLGYGQAAKDVVPTLQAVNKAVVATGRGSEEMQRIVDVLGTMQARGKASAVDINRLAQAGVPVQRILQKQLGLTGEQVSNIGKEGIEAEKVIQAIAKGWNQEFGGAYEDARETFGFQMAGMIKDFEQFQREALAPVFEFLRVNVIPRVREFLSLLIDMPQQAKTAAVGIAVAIGLLASPLAGLAVVGAAIGSIGYLLYRNRDTVTAWGKAAIKWFKGASEWVVRAANNVKEWVATAAQNVAGFVQALIPVKIAIALVEGAFKTFSPIVKMHLKIAWEYVKFFWETAKIAFEGTWIVIKTGWNIIKRLGAIIGNVVGIVSNLLRGDFSGAWENVKDLIGNVVGIVTDAWQGFLEFFGKIPGRIFDLIKTIPGRIAGVAATLWDGFKDSFRGFLEWLRKEAEKIKDTVVDAVPKPLRDAFGASKDVGSAFFKGFLGAGANGLIADRPGMALVGERGPEVVKLGKGDTVIPNELSFGGLGGETVINVPLYLDGRKVAEATARHVANAAAAA